MIKEGGRVEDDFKKEGTEGVSPNQNDRHHFNDERDDDFNRMKTDASCDIKVDIGMVHPVKPPKERDEMEADMLQVDHKIENQNRQRKGKGLRRFQQMHQSPMLFFSELCGCVGRSPHEKINEGCVEKMDGDIDRPAMTFRLQ